MKCTSIVLCLVALGCASPIPRTFQPVGPMEKSLAVRDDVTPRAPTPSVGLVPRGQDAIGIKRDASPPVQMRSGGYGSYATYGGGRYASYSKYRDATAAEANYGRYKN